MLLDGYCASGHLAMRRRVAKTNTPTVIAEIKEISQIADDQRKQLSIECAQVCVGFGFHARTGNLKQRQR